MSSMLSLTMQRLRIGSPFILTLLALQTAAAQPIMPPAPAPAPTVKGVPASDPVAGPLAQWAQLRRSDALPFSSYANFLLSHKDWPNEGQMRRNAERAIRMDQESPSLVIAFFRLHPPQTPAGWLRFAEALDARNTRDEAVEAARKAWTSGVLGADDESRLLARFGDDIGTDDHDARMDRLLWLRSTSTAMRQLPLTSAGRRANFEVRLALLTKAPDASDRLAYATRPVRNDPGFIADYMWWLRNTDQGGVAREILRQNMEMATYPAAPDVWLQMLLISAQDAAKAGSWQAAYDIASRAATTYPPGTIVRDRPFSERDSYTDLVWLAGQTAMDRLSAPSKAAAMYTLYANAARSPQTQARGWYWAGRAYKAAGRGDDARTAFETAARFGDQFHGQLAAEQLGRKPDISKDAISVEITSQDRAAFLNRSVVRAMLALGRAGNWSEQSLFVRAIANAVSTDAEHVLAAELSSQAGRPDLNVLVGRNARNSGLSGYMRTAFPQLSIPAEFQQSWTMIHAISRQESQFDRAAMSPVGARGLMQLMPGTARDMARMTGVAYRESALTTDPVYNISLGSAYFGRLMDQYGGSYVLAVAAYNAGPGNVNRWLRTNGDPRRDTDVLKWIEAIPFSETRNYVQRVLENAVVYDMLNPSRANVRSNTPLSTYLGKRNPG